MSLVAPKVPLVVLTRPQPEADRWCAALRERGYAAEALPLMAIQPLTSDPALARIRAGLATRDVVFCVSAQAARSFWDANPPVWGGATRFWAPGPGTAKALVALGVPPDRIDSPALDAPQFDSEALWAVVGHRLQPGSRVLVVRGGGANARAGDAGQGRDWLTQRCAAAGAVVDACVAYRRVLPVWSVAEQTLARQAVAKGGVWVFSSSEAVGNLGTLCPELPWAHLHALATHPRIAQTLGDRGVTSVYTVRPTLPDLLSGLESVAHG